MLLMWKCKKLDRLIANLGNVYTVYRDWGMPFRRRFYKLKGTQHLMIMIACLSGGCAVSMILPYNNVIFNDHTLLTLSPL